MNREPRTMQVADAVTASRAPENTPAMVKKIGKTTYKVHVHFSNIVNVLDNFDAICTDLSSGLPAEIEARQKQYEYYRDKLLSFEEKI